MPVTIKLSGPMLVRSKRANPDIIVPNGETSDLPNHQFPDGKSEARPHYSRLLMVDAQGRELTRVDLLDADVQVSDAAGGQCTVAPSLSTMIGFGSVIAPPPQTAPLMPVPDDTAEFRKRVATTISFVGGTLAGGEMSTSQWDLPVNDGSAPTKRTLPIGPEWSSKAATAMITVTDRASGRKRASVTVEPGCTAFIYNLDDENSGVRELTFVDVTSAAEDGDFRWVYMLYDPPTNVTWPQWLRDTALAAPIFTPNSAAASARFPFPIGGGCRGAVI